MLAHLVRRGLFPQLAAILAAACPEPPVPAVGDIGAPAAPRPAVPAGEALATALVVRYLALQGARHSERGWWGGGMRLAASCVMPSCAFQRTVDFKGKAAGQRATRSGACGAHPAPSSCSFTAWRPPQVPSLPASPSPPAAAPGRPTRCRPALPRCSACRCCSSAAPRCAPWRGGSGTSRSQRWQGSRPAAWAAVCPRGWARAARGLLPRWQATWSRGHLGRSRCGGSCQCSRKCSARACLLRACFRPFRLAGPARATWRLRRHCKLAMRCCCPALLRETPNMCPTISAGGRLPALRHARSGCPVCARAVHAAAPAAARALLPAGRPLGRCAPGPPGQRRRGSTLLCSLPHSHGGHCASWTVQTNDLAPIASFLLTLTRPPPPPLRPGSR